MNLFKNLFKFYPVEPLLKDKDFIVCFYRMRQRTDNRKIIEELIENFCYDRDFCEEHKIDYCNITGRDILNIKKHIIQTLKEHALI